MSTGWVKTHRKLVNWEWYDDLPCFRLFMHLLLTVNYKPTRYHGHDIPIGAKVCGLPTLSKQTGLTVQQLRTAIKKLKSTENITVSRTNKFSIVSITNWHEYQDDNSQATVKQQSSNSQSTTSKEERKKRREEKSIVVPDFVDGDVWLDFVKHRGGKKFTQLMATRIINQLMKWNDEGYDANQILNNSIMNDYKGIFLPKESRNGNKTGDTAHEKMFAGFMQADTGQP